MRFNNGSVSLNNHGQIFRISISLQLTETVECHSIIFSNQSIDLKEEKNKTSRKLIFNSFEYLRIIRKSEGHYSFEKSNWLFDESLEYQGRNQTRKNKERNEESNFMIRRTFSSNCLTAWSWRGGRRNTKQTNNIMGKLQRRRSMCFLFSSLKREWRTDEICWISTIQSKFSSTYRCRSRSTTLKKTVFFSMTIFFESLRVFPTYLDIEIFAYVFFLPRSISKKDDWCRMTRGNLWYCSNVGHWRIAVFLK